jgi:hypothetical protein
MQHAVMDSYYTVTIQTQQEPKHMLNIASPAAGEALAADYSLDPRQAYLEWLRMEARLLQMELAPELDPESEFSPCGTFARGFHFPRGGWQSAPKPSTRALAVMRAAGVVIPEDAA